MRKMTYLILNLLTLIVFSGGAEGQDRHVSLKAQLLKKSAPRCYP